MIVTADETAEISAVEFTNDVEVETETEPENETEPEEEESNETAETESEPQSETTTTVVETGDNTPVLPYLAAMLASVLVMIAGLAERKRRAGR